MARKLEQSRKLQKRAEKMIPGGVNSPVRAFRGVGGDPLFVLRGQGSHIWDADENEYIDYIGSWGPLILGHGARRGNAQRHQLRSLDAIRGRPGRTGGLGIPSHSESPLREFGHRGDHVGDPARPRLHETQIHREI